MSNKKRKRLISPTLSNVPLVEPKVVGDPTGNESLAEFRRRYNREQKQQSEAAIQQSVAELTDTMIQLRAAQREALFKVPSEELAAVTSQVPEYVEGSVDEVRSQIKSALHTVIMELSRSGVTLRDSGRDKMVVVSRLNLTVDWRVAANWRKLYEHMSESGLNVFTDEDVSLPKKPEPPAPTPTIDAILNQNNGETTEGRKRMVKAVEDTLINREWRNCWAGFANSIYYNFDGYMLNEREKQTFYDTMVRRNLSLNRPADYDTCRVALVRSGDLGKGFPHLLYPSEILASQIEDADLNDREVRRQIAQRTRQLATQN
jgi:hypothetical protein